MNEQLWSWLLAIVGITGFILAGRKIWWAWWVNLACQVLWFAYGFFTDQWGFVAASIAYTIVFAKNAISWTSEHQIRKRLAEGVEKGEFYAQFDRGGRADYAAHDVQLTMDLFKSIPPEHFQLDPRILKVAKVYTMPTEKEAEHLKRALREIEEQLASSDVTNGEIFLSNYILATDAVDTAVLGGWICKRATAMGIDLICMLIPEFNGQRIVWYPGNISEYDTVNVD